MTGFFVPGIIYYIQFITLILYLRLDHRTVCSATSFMIMIHDNDATL